MRINKTALALLGLSTTLLTGSALAADDGNRVKAGDVLVRVGAAGVYPNDDSDNLKGLPNGYEVGVGNAWSAGLTVSYMATDNIGVGLLAAWPFKHDIRGEKDISSLGDIGSTKQLPPTLTLQYHFPLLETVKPYVGVGLNYTWFFDTDGKGPVTDLDLDNSWGWAVEAGVDVTLYNNWFFNVSGWYIDIDTKADATIANTTKTSVDVDIDPWVVMVGFGRRF